MPGTGFKSVGIKEEVYNELKERAKEEEKSISMYLAELLEREGKTKGKESILTKVFKTNGLTKEDLRREIDKLREEIKRDGKEDMVITDTNVGITLQDLKNALLGLENDIDLKIRELLNEVMKRL